MTSFIKETKAIRGWDGENKGSDLDRVVWGSLPEVVTFFTLIPDKWEGDVMSNGGKTFMQKP